jgi:hypothetical protein
MRYRARAGTSLDALSGTTRTSPNALSGALLFIGPPIGRYDNHANIGAFRAMLFPAPLRIRSEPSSHPEKALDAEFTIADSGQTRRRKAGQRRIEPQARVCGIT